MTSLIAPFALHLNLVVIMIDLGAAKLFGILFESLGYGECSASVLIPCVRSHRPFYHDANGRHILYGVRVQYVFANTRPLEQGCTTSQLTSTCLLGSLVHDDYHCKPLLFRRCCIHSLFLTPSRPQRWATEVARLYDVVVVLDGRISASDYFADLTLKKQIIVTSLAELQIVVADFILVSFLVLATVVQLLTRGSSCTACTTYGSPTGGSALSLL